ncbi:MAG: methyltransferase [Candidatus Lokiarchaeota archaeon]|nr:methyltransferase [Candidatus Lokiarchaeota archaeon]
MLEYLGCKYEVFNHVYNPSDDSFLLARNLNINENDSVLEIGTGCGIISIIAALNGAKCISIDISSFALKCAKYNSKVNYVNNRIDFILSDLFSSLKMPLKFDKILFNPPYLPEEEPINDVIEKSWNGGKRGNELILRFLDDLNHFMKKNTIVLLVISSLSKKEEIYRKIREKSFKYQILDSEKHFFEKIMVLEIKK